MADKKPKLGDYIEVKMPGVATPQPIYRASSMTDDEWEQVKVNATKSGRIVSEGASSNASKATMAETNMADDFESAKQATSDAAARASKRLSPEKIRALASNLNQVSDSLISKDEKEALSGMSDENARAEYLRARLKRRGYDVPDSAAAPAANTKPFGDVAKEQGSPSEWKSMPEAKPNPTTQTEDDAMVGSADPGMSVRGQMARLATGGIGSAIPSRENKLEQARKSADEAVIGMKADEAAHTREADRENFALQDARIGAARAAQDMQAQADYNTPGSIGSRQRLYGGDAASRTAADESGGYGMRPYESTPATPQEDQRLFPSLGRGIKAIGRGAGEMVRSATDELGITDPALPPDPEAAPVVPPVKGGVPVQPRQQPTQEMPGDSVAMGMKKSGGGGAPSAQTPNLYGEISSAQMKGAELAANSHALAADVERKRALGEKAVQEEKLRNIGKVEEQRLAAETAYRKALDDGTSAYNSIIDERRSLMNQKVDPDRYWNEGGAGKKFLATLSGALFGWSGQGMQFLQRLDGLVARDIKLQQDELARKGDALSSIAGDQKNIIALAKERGMSDLAAVEAAKLARFEEAQTQMQMLAAEAGAGMANANLQMNLGALATKVAEQRMALQQALSMDAARRAQTAQGWAKLRQDKEEMYLKAAASSAKGGNGMKFSPGEVGRMDAAQQGLEATKLLKKTLGPESSLGGALYDEVTKRAGQLSEAGRRQKAVEPQRRAIIRLIDASAIQKADAEFWKDKISNVGLDNMSQSDLDGLMKFFESQHDAVVKTREQLGSYVGSDTPDFPETPAE